MSEELYKVHRPTSFKEVVGQKQAVKTLVQMGKDGKVPHTILFTGPSGCGKTTLARILKDKLGCSDADFYEINAADSRGIDTIREIRRQMGSAPLGGKCRVWLIDEAHSLTGDAQNSFLKVLEDTPRHVYFMLATTDPQKLKKTIITRSTEIRCSLLTEDELKELIVFVAEKEDVMLADEVVAKIAECADGSGRKALVLLHAVIRQPDKAAQLEAIEKGDVKNQAIQIARALLSKTTTWAKMQAILKSVDEDPESIRHMVMAYCRNVLLGKGDWARAVLVIQEFRDPWYECKEAGLQVSCYNVVAG